MATRLWLMGTQNHPRAAKMYPGFPAYRGLGSIRLVGATANAQKPSGPTTPVVQLATTSAASNKVVYWSERVAAPFTLSGNVIANVWGSCTTGTLTRIRVELSKITPGGSDVETVLGTGDTTADLTATSTAYTVTIPVPTIDIGVNERFLLRLYAFRTDGATPTVMNVTANVPATEGTTGDTWIELPGNPTFRPDDTLLSLRRTTTIGIGSFMDLSETFGSGASTTAVVNTSAGATEIVWTKTAGGTVAEWISPRLSAQWDTLAGLANGKLMAKVMMAAKESATAANASLRYKIFARDPDGVESMILQGEPWGVGGGSGDNITTTLTNYGPIASGSSVYNQNPNVGEDWRLVFRAYIIKPAGLTMAGGQTVTFNYDGPLPVTTVGTSYVRLYDLPLFKAESDPPKSFVVPSGQSMSGLGNGQ